MLDWQRKKEILCIVNLLSAFQGGAKMIRTIKNWIYEPVDMESLAVREAEDFIASLIGRKKAGRIIDEQVSYLMK